MRVHLVLLGNWNDTFEEVRDSFPVIVGLDLARTRLAIGLRLGIGKFPGAVAGAAATGGACGAWNAQKRQIVFDALYGRPAERSPFFWHARHRTSGCVNR